MLTLIDPLLITVLVKSVIFLFGLIDLRPVKQKVANKFNISLPD